MAAGRDEAGRQAAAGGIEGHAEVHNAALASTLGLPGWRMVADTDPVASDPVDALLLYELTARAQDHALERDRARARLIAAEVAKLFPKGKKG